MIQFLFFASLSITVWKIFLDKSLLKSPIEGSIWYFFSLSFSLVIPGKAWRETTKTSSHRSWHVLWKRLMLSPSRRSMDGGRRGQVVGRRGHRRRSSPPSCSPWGTRPQSMPGSGWFTLRTAIVVVADSPHADGAVVGAGEDVTVVDGDRVDRRVVRFHLAHQSTWLHWPVKREIEQC